MLRQARQALALVQSSTTAVSASTAERALLDSALRRQAAAARLLDAAREAEGAGTEMLHQALEEAEAAGKALQEAREATAVAVAAAAGKGKTAPPMDRLHMARNRVQVATDSLEAVRAALPKLKEAVEKRYYEGERAKQAVDEALAAACAPSVNELQKRTWEQWAAVQTNQNTLTFLANRGIRPTIEKPSNSNGYRADERWATALTALLRDPDTPLPAAVEPAA
jgi:hypothetical protein